MAVPRSEPHPGLTIAPWLAGMLERARLAGEIAGAYLRTRRALSRAPVAALVAELRAGASGSALPQGGDSLAQARHLGSAVVRTLALMPGDTRCLARSLVLTRLLARRGIQATVVIGTRTAPTFAAHAWVEHAGQPVLSAGDGSFGRLVEL